MANETPERAARAAAPTITSRHAGCIFRTVKNYGPWRKADPELNGKPNVFTDAEFRKRLTIPEKADDVDPATYHDDLLDRGLALGAIVCDPGATPTPTPLGPGNTSRPGPHAIRESTEAILAQKAGRDALEKAMTPRAQAAGDAAQRDQTVQHGTVVVKP